MSAWMHDPDGYQCAPEECGGTRLDPCHYTVDDARRWCRAVYVVGGAGTGKSTFMRELLDAYVMGTGPLTDLHSKRNAGGALVTLRGHEVSSYHGRSGVYLGVLRESFPGTDGLDRATSATATEWCEPGAMPDFIVAEGATLATRPFLTALHAVSELMVVRLYADPEEVSRRCEQRGSKQDPQWMRATVTRSANTAEHARKLGARVLELDTTDPTACELGMEIVLWWLAREQLALVVDTAVRLNQPLTGRNHR